MEEELSARLDKVAVESYLLKLLPTELINITISTLEAIRAHIQELHPAAIGDILPLEEAVEVVKDYR